MTALSQPSLSGGEISPSLYGRIDLARYLTSLRTCRNFIPLSYGGAKNRAGTRFVEEVKDSSKFTRLIPFQFSTDQAYVLEMGEEYGRVFRNGARVTLLAMPDAWATGTAYVLGNHVAQGGVNYYCATAHTSGTFATDLAAGDWYALTDDICEFPTEWLEGDLPILKTTQSADVLTLCHVDYQPTNISRTAHDTWTVEPITFEFGPFEDVNTDTSVTVFPSTTSGTGITLTSSSALFTAADVGKLFYLEQKDYGQSWEAGVTVAVGDIRRAEGKYYKDLAGTTTGTLRPTNDTDNWNDGKCNWMFLHPGFGIALITAYTSATAVTATAVTRLPDAMVGPAAYVAGTTYAAAAQVFDGLIAYVSLAGSNTGHTPASSPTWWTPISTYKWAKGVWNETDGYPGCVTYHQQRQAFAGSPQQPQTVWMSKTADFTNFGKSSPIVDDDTLTYPLAGKQVNQVRHMVSLGGALIALTSDSNWTITGNESGGVLTPSVVQAKPQSYLGSSDVPPLTVGNKAIYVQDKGGVVRDLGYEYASDSFTGTDLSILASHLLEGHSITDWAYQQAPFGVIWAVRDDGLLLSLTYQKEQDVFAWAHHDLGEGLVESCCVVSEGLEDVLYLIVKRTIGGATKRYIERMTNRVITDILDAFFVDSGLSYDGRNATATTITATPAAMTIPVFATDEPFVPTGTTGQLAVGVDTVAADAHITSLTRTDWQGVQALSATARENRLLWSDDFSNAAWLLTMAGSASLPVVTPNYGVAPDGTTTADRVVMTTNGDNTTASYANIRQVLSVGTSACVDSIWIRTTDSSVKTILFRDDSSTAIKNIVVTEAWTRYELPKPTPAAAQQCCKLWVRGGLSPISLDADLLVWRGQNELGLVATPGIPTTTAPVTITDYTTTDAGAVTLGEPASGTYEWTGSGTASHTGTAWDQTETVTLTASASIFVAGDVGDAIVFVESDWTRYAFTISSHVSGTQVLAVPNKLIPVAYRNTARADWNFARINLFGLDHLEGETVAVFMDGNEHPQCVVSGGEVVLERPGYYVHIGLPIVADIETLDLAVYGGETIRDKKKLVSKVSVQVESTRGLFIGTDALHLKEWKQSHATLVYDEPMPLETGLAEVFIPGTWDKNGRIFIRQSSPLPVQILALIPEVSVGGS